VGLKVVAPGKLVLLGEYAVLDGAPAIVAAVDHGVVCRVEPASALTIDTTGDDRFVRRALEVVRAPPGRYAFAAANPSPGAGKLGLGGSAAATVAAVVAGTGGTWAAADVQRVAHEVHAEVQGGGSGVDVAASVHGGVLRFEKGGVTPLEAVAPSVVFTGTSAETAPRVERYLAWSDRKAFVRAMGAAVDAFSSDPIGAMGVAGALLRSMAERAGIPYWTEAIDKLVHLADDHGGVAKPSGAGGGDVVVALFPDPSQSAAWESAAAAAGFVVVPVKVSEGVKLIADR
jgi:phosphomevalonate kinase